MAQELRAGKAEIVVAKSCSFATARGAETQSSLGGGESGAISRGLCLPSPGHSGFYEDPFPVSVLVRPPGPSRFQGQEPP